MADQGFGITRAAARELTRVIARNRQQLPATGQRTRRVWPDNGDGLTLLEYTSTTALLGAVDGDGIEATGNCEIVSSPGTTYSVTAGTYFHGLIIPNTQFWGVRDGSTFRVVSGGVTQLVGPCTGDGDTTITVSGDWGSVDVQFFPQCGYESTFAENQQLTLGVAYGLTSDTKVALTVLYECCPPDPA